MPSGSNGNGKTNGKKINGTAMGKMLNVESSDLHPDVIRFMETLAWVRRKHEAENVPRLKEIQAQVEVSDSHRTDMKQRAQRVLDLIQSQPDEDDDPVIHVIDITEP